MTPEGWTATTIGKLTRVTSGGTPSRTIAAYWGGNIPWITTGQIRFNTIVSAEEKITQEGLNNSSAKLFPPQTLLVALYGDGVTRGKVAILGIEAATNQACAAILPSENVRHDYLFYFLKSQYEALRGESTTGNQSNLSGSLIKSFPVLLPPLSEQQKIATILSTWDRAIELTAQLIAVKQRRKLALMQELLTGHVRLTGFKGNWISIKMGDVFQRRSESGIPGLPTLSVTIDRGLVRRDSIERKMETTLEAKQHLLVRKGDIAYNMMRMWQGASGLALEDGIISPAYIVLKPKPNVDPLFASYFFKLRQTVRQFEDFSFGLTGDRLRLYFKGFAAIPTKFPGLLEQQKIAAILFAQDREIDLHRQKLDALRRQKKGLMQQLLTGKVRVNVPAEAPEV